jgi:hypothetical protein
LLGKFDPLALHRHPKGGASWRGFAVDRTLRIVRPDKVCFWATHFGGVVRTTPAFGFAATLQLEALAARG